MALGLPRAERQTGGILQQLSNLNAKVAAELAVDTALPVDKRSLFKNWRRNDVPGDRQRPTIQRDRQRNSGSKLNERYRQELFQGSKLEEGSKQPADAVDLLTKQEINRRLAVCAGCIEANKGALDEDNCAICASDGILATMLLSDDWAIEAARSISLEGIKVKGRR